MGLKVPPKRPIFLFDVSVFFFISAPLPSLGVWLHPVGIMEEWNDELEKINRQYDLFSLVF